MPERELATLRAGQPVTLAADALPGQSFTGTVDRIAPVVDSGSGTFRVVSAFDGAAHALQPGMFGRIRIDYDQRADALVVPRPALLDDGEPAVFRVREGKVARVPVKLGYAEGPWVEIRDGRRPVIRWSPPAGRAARRYRSAGDRRSEGKVEDGRSGSQAGRQGREQAMTAQGHDHGASPESDGAAAGMRGGLVEFATRRRVTIAMCTVTLLLFGLIALGNLKVNLLPDLSYPTLTVRTEYTGAAPTEIETLITQPVEEAVGVVRTCAS